MLPSFQSLLDSANNSAHLDLVPTSSSSLAAANNTAGHYPLSDIGTSPFFSSSSSFFSSSSSFFSSSGELSSLLSSSSSSSMRRGKESPVAPSSPRQTAAPLPLVPSAPLTSFLGAAFTTTSSTTTTTTTHTTSAFKPISVGLAPAPCTLPLISPQQAVPFSGANGEPLMYPRNSSVMPGPSSSYTISPSSALPFPTTYATVLSPAVYAGAGGAANMSATVSPLPSDARALLGRKERSSTAVNVSLAQGSSKPAGVRVCTMCGTTKTKQWRSGSDGKPSLCNACGLRYRKDSLGQKFKFKQVVIFPSGTTSFRKRKTLLADDKSKVDSVDEKELTASLATAKSSSSSSSSAPSTKKRRQTSPAADAQQAGHRSREGSPDRKSDIYSLLN